MSRTGLIVVSRLGLIVDAPGRSAPCGDQSGAGDDNSDECCQRQKPTPSTTATRFFEECFGR
jgi:hypothetical protein